MSCVALDDLVPASFRGVPFEVKHDAGTYGRRIALHEYPMRDKPYPEDMGEKAQKFEVTGYVSGDNWIAKKEALVAACRARGPSMLQLPADTPKFVVCNHIKVARNVDTSGMLECTMEFTAADNMSFGMPLGAFEGLIGTAFNTAIAILTTYYDDGYSSDVGLPYVQANQTNRIAAFAQDIADLVGSYPSLNTALSTDVTQTAVTVYQAAAQFASPDRKESVTLCSLPIPAAVIAFVGDNEGITATNTNGTGITVGSGASAVVPLVAYLIGRLGNSLAPDDAITALTTLANFSVGETSVASLQNRIPSPLRPLTTLPSNIPSPSDITDATNGSLFCGIVRSFALMKLAQAIATKTFRNRVEAIQARANVVELFSVQVDMFDEDLTANAVLTARDLAVTAVTQQMATLVPVITITAPQSMPSLYWANRLYEDLYRAEPLADRNDVASPAFMPVIFEALTS